MKNDYENCLCNIEHKAEWLDKSVRKETQAILKKRRKMDNSGDAAKPLIVLAGEAHTDPRDHLRHLMTIDMLRKTESAIGVAYEYEHNRALQEYVMSGRNVNDDVRQALAEENRKGALSLRTSYVPRLNGRVGLHSRAILFRYLQRSGLPFLFNDCARPAFKIDTSDAETKLSARMYYGDEELPEEIDVRAGEGIAIRNIHMVRLAKDFARDNGLRIVFQQCGAAHVLGSRKGSYEEGMACLAKNDPELGVIALDFSRAKSAYQKATKNVGRLRRDEVLFRPDIRGLAAHYDGWSPEAVPINARLDHHRTIKQGEKAEGYDLANHFLFCHKLATGILRVSTDNLENRNAEANYANRLLSALGYDRERMSVRTFRRWQAENIVEREAVFAAC